MDKEPGAFWTIGEVAKELELPQSVLRYWEKEFPQIRPTKRGDNGRRYYRPEDVDLIRGIRTLLYDEGYKIKGVLNILREAGVPAVREIGAAGESQLNYDLPAAGDDEEAESAEFDPLPYPDKTVYHKDVEREEAAQPPVPTPAPAVGSPGPVFQQRRPAMAESLPRQTDLFDSPVFQAGLAAGSTLGESQL
ncbi:MAG: MerR family transcriptional regulator, partial [Methylobacteriaceae bacterium]|nr:MerR family transcriptional regulator [Methylobacteriaceae bacterium]